MKSGALEGLSVLELGTMVAAPYCAKLLADLGADVLKIEPPGGGDSARRQGPFPDDVPHPERSALFLYLNTSKRSITLDPSTLEGRRILRRLAADADVLIEDRPPGELQALGLGYDDLTRLNPRLIVTSITPFGQTGPHRDDRTHPINQYHCGGYSSRFYADEEGDERPPARGGGYLGEYDAGLTASVGTLAAVLGRAATGCGRHVDVSKQEASMGLERVDVGRFANDPDPQPWRGSIGGLIPAKDGHFVITPLANHQWQGLIQAMGEPEWSKEEWCRTEVGRMESRDEIQPRVEEWARGLTRDEIYHSTQAGGAPSGPVRNVAEVRDWVQTRERGFFVPIEHPDAGVHAYPSAPYRLSETPWAGTAAPRLGEHNRAVYCESLAYSPQDLVRLAAAGVI